MCVLFQEGINLLTPYHKVTHLYVLTEFDKLALDVTTKVKKDTVYYDSLLRTRM